MSPGIRPTISSRSTIARIGPDRAGASNAACAAVPSAIAFALVIRGALVADLLPAGGGVGSGVGSGVAPTQAVTFVSTVATAVCEAAGTLAAQSGSACAAGIAACRRGMYTPSPASPPYARAVTIGERPGVVPVMEISRSKAAAFAVSSAAEPDIAGVHWVLLAPP